MSASTSAYQVLELTLKNGRIGTSEFDNKREVIEYLVSFVVENRQYDKEYIGDDNDAEYDELVHSMGFKELAAVAMQIGRRRLMKQGSGIVAVIQGHVVG